MSYIQGKSLGGLLWCSVLRLWWRERLRGGGGAHRSECKSARPKGIFASARLDAHLFRQSGVSSRILANNISSASFSFRRGSSALYFWTLCPFASVGCRRFCFFVVFFLYFLHVGVCLHGPGVHPSASARKREASIPREMCFLVAEAGTRLVAGWIIMSKQNRSHQK